MTRLPIALWITALCAFGSACSSDDGGGDPAGGTPDSGIVDPPGGDDTPDAGHQPPTEECAASCDGCCDGDACLSGSSPSACGGGGGACETCDPGFVCEAAACTVDRTSRWDVLADSGDVFEDNLGGGTWDAAGGLPDPYVHMEATDGVGDLVEESDAVGDTLAPTWNQVVLADVPAGPLVDTGISTTLYDDDALLDASDPMGTCLVPITDADFTGNSVSFVCPFDADAGARGWTLRFRLIRK